MTRNELRDRLLGALIVAALGAVSLAAIIWAVFVLIGMWISAVMQVLM
tara:strand:+ start:78 stop:221 length:144 start_codon:yes stop_codon:yes gene_type:complete